MEVWVLNKSIELLERVWYILSLIEFGRGVVYVLYVVGEGVVYVYLY